MKLQQGKIVNVQQGSSQWHELRAKRFTASEAAAAMGKHKYMSRNDLLKQKATGLVPEVSAHQQRIFDDGHRAEASARPLVEAIIQDDLYPVVLDDEDGGFLASMDGLSMDGSIGFEHKWLSADLSSQIDAGKLDEHYLIQLDQQFALSGAEKIIFVGSDGTQENFKHLWIDRDESRFADVEAGWLQFAKDLAEYIPSEAEAPKAEGKAPDSLPSLVVRASGVVETSNLKEFEAIARATLAKINTDLQTDNDFADAEKAVKFCADVEKRLDGARENVLGQMQTVDEVVRSIDAIKEETRQIRLKLSSAVKSQKESRKLEILTAARAAYSKFYNALESALEVEAGGIAITLSNGNGPDFGWAMKGKRTISSLNDACDDLLANVKIELNETAEIIRANIRQLNESASDYRFLFSDFGQLCQKPEADFAAIVKSRIADHKQAEHDRLEAERAKIRAEEEVKARREAEAAAQAAEVVQPEAVQKKAAPAKPQNMQRPTANELAAVIADHYGVTQSTAMTWIIEANAKINNEDM